MNIVLAIIGGIVVFIGIIICIQAIDEQNRKLFVQAFLMVLVGAAAMVLHWLLTLIIFP